MKKIVIITGSPRKGATEGMADAFQAAAEKIRFLIGRQLERSFSESAPAPSHKEFDREAVKKLKVLTYSKYLESRGIHDTLLHKQQCPYRFVPNLRSIGKPL